MSFDVNGESLQLSKVSRAINELSQVLNDMHAAIEWPKIKKFTQPDELERLRFSSPDARTIQLLLFVRIISGCNAIVALLRSGYIVESRVIMRTVDDFLGDILFVEDAIKAPGEGNVHQKKSIANYFLETHDPLKEYTTRRQKVQAAEARVVDPNNPYEVAQVSANIDKSFDAAVHGDYSPVMDLYVLSRRNASGRFEVNGVTSEGQIAIYRLALSFLVHRASACMILIAQSMKNWNLHTHALGIFHRINDEISFDEK